MLGDLSLLPDGGTAAPAAWQDWLKALEKAKKGSVDARLHSKKGRRWKKVLTSVLQATAGTASRFHVERSRPAAPEHGS